MRILRWLLAFLLSCSALLHSQTSADALQNGFLNPPNSAKPRVWWHWMNGNITKDGIKLDLEWMNRVGIGGFQNFDADLNTPVFVDHRLSFMSPAWKDAFHYATDLADRLGLEMAIAGSPGWSEAGGPWVPPAEAMKKLVWSETLVHGGETAPILLRKPPTTTGPFQNVPSTDSLDSKETVPTLYVDTAVLACRLPVQVASALANKPSLSASDNGVRFGILDDHDLVATTNLRVAPLGEKAWIQFEYPNPQTIGAVTLAIPIEASFFKPAPKLPTPQLEASDDGTTFRHVVTLSQLPHGFSPHGETPQWTVAFAPVTARYFRVTWTTEAHDETLTDDMRELGIAPPKPATEYKIAELVLHPEAYVNHFEEKAGFATTPDLYSYPTPNIPAAQAIEKKDIVDLTSKMTTDGNLEWTPPPGDWVVLRFGFSLTGAQNSPASPEATGLEVDKLDRKFVKNYMDRYLAMYADTTGPQLIGHRGLRFMVNDSWEAGAQNWTDSMPTKFAALQGYDLRLWMPVLAGLVVESAEASDRFLWDFRHTISTLVADEFYGQLQASLKQRGLGHYGESHEDRRAFIGDGMQVKKRDDIPMGAMWVQRSPKEETFRFNADLRESASVSHIYGKNLVGAESLPTVVAPFAWSPELLKPTADKEFANGVNRIMIHTSVHQPFLDKAPGLSLAAIGQWFTRNETWAEYAKPWLTYLARSSYMLQQGRFVADVLYFYGEDSNITALFGDKAPPVPSGYDFDYVNADALIHQLSVSNGRIVTPSGMSYRVLALDPFSRHMSLPVLKKIRDLVTAGANVCGPKPIATPSLGDDAKEFAAIADQLWDAHQYDKGKVYSGQELSAVLNELNIAPDFDYSKPHSDTNLLYVHRTLAEGEVYWIDNRNSHDEALQASFRVAGKEAELWYPDTGVVEPASYTIANGRTTVPLKLEPWGTVFVVFRNPSKADSRVLPATVATTVATVEGPWNVTFQADRGAPPQTTFEKLASWSDNTNEGIKYFSGTATYTKQLEASPAWFKSGSKIWLDLGDVKNIAEVTVNGKPLGIAWKKPFRVDATSALKPGANDLLIKVTNLWVNRIIGDRQPNAARKYTFTSMPFYKSSSPLLPSGLIGPVTVVREVKVTARK